MIPLVLILGAIVVFVTWDADSRNSS